MNKRRGDQSRMKPAKRRPTKQAESDEESIDSSDEGLNSPTNEKQVDSDMDDFFEETVDEKRIRLAKSYIEDVKASVKKTNHDDSSTSDSNGSHDDASDSDDDVDSKLRRDLKVKRQQVKHFICDSLSVQSTTFTRGHKSSPTCVRVSPDSSSILTGGKDGDLLLWDVETQKKMVFTHKTESISPVLAVEYATPSVLVSAGEDKVIRLWDVRTPTACRTLRGHQGRVTGLRFVQDGENPGRLYSCGADKAIKVWLVESTSGKYLESYFGHTGEVLSMDVCELDKPVTGGADHTCRSWSLANDSHQLFSSAHTAQVDCVASLDAKHFVSGGQDGSLCVWGTSYKKAMVVTADAHGQGSWISSIAAVRNTDLVASGSAEGIIRLWKVAKADGVDVKKKHKISMDSLDEHNIAVDGVVNGLDFSRNGRVLAAAVGRDQRLGRWISAPKAKNGLLIASLSHDVSEL